MPANPPAPPPDDAGGETEAHRGEVTGSKSPRESGARRAESLDRVSPSAQSLSRVQLFATPWTLTHQALLSMGFPRQKYWSGLPFPPPGDLPDSRTEPTSLVSPAFGRWVLYLGRPSLPDDAPQFG